MGIDERSCIDCKAQTCATQKGNYPDFCPTAALSDDEIQASAAIYDEDNFALKVMQVASFVNVDAFAKRWCRVEESLEFFKRMGWKKIGIASCAGLNEEATIFAKILRVHGFEPYAARSPQFRRVVLKRLRTAAISEPFHATPSCKPSFWRRRTLRPMS